MLLELKKNSKQRLKNQTRPSLNWKIIHQSGSNIVLRIIYIIEIIKQKMQKSYKILALVGILK